MNLAPEALAASAFDRFGLCEALRRGVADAGYVELRPIQAEAIGPILEGRDVLGLAQTGTGKTAAFALPILERLLATPQTIRRGPRALVLAPTRELAIQIAEDFHMLGKHARARVCLVYGGVPERKQIEELRRGPDVVVACPGRLLDLLQRKLARLDAVETLVLDEADHMFDMGFLPDLRRILAALPERRQNLLFSATMPREIRGLAEQILKDPFEAQLTHSAPPATIEHELYPVVEAQKLMLLERLLADSGFTCAIIFTRTKHRAKRLALQLSKGGHNAVALQGNMSQAQRDRAMTGFRAKRFDVLVATDIVARGIDIEKVSHVINFDVPNTPDAYTHRIGRTGRSERDGKAFTFVTEEDFEMVQAIERRLGKSIPRTSIEGFEMPVEPTRRSGGFEGRFGAGRSQGQGRRSQGGHPRQGDGQRAGRSHGGGQGGRHPRDGRGPRGQHGGGQYGGARGRGSFQGFRGIGPVIEPCKTASRPHAGGSHAASRSDGDAFGHGLHASSPSASRGAPRAETGADVSPRPRRKGRPGGGSAPFSGDYRRG